MKDDDRNTSAPLINSPTLKKAIKKINPLSFSIDLVRNIYEFITSIRGDLSSLELNLLGPVDWSFLWKEIAEQTLIEDLNLTNNDLGKMNETSWKAFCEGLASNRTLRELALCNNHLENLNVKQWDSFNEALKSNRTLQKLDFGNNNISLIQGEKIMAAFCSAIFGNHHFDTLNLFNSGLTSIKSESLFSIFCEAYATNTSLKSIIIVGNKLGLLQEKYWELLCKAMSTKAHLDLGNSQLECLEKDSPKKWEQFCGLISESPKLKTLEFCNTHNIKEISEKGWALFGKAVANSKTIERINLDLCSMSGLSEKSWEVFCSGLQQNKSLKSLSMDEHRYHPLGIRNEKGWKQFLQVALWNESLLHIHCNAVIELPDEREQYKDGFERMEKIQIVLTSKKKTRHGRALALAHSLCSLKIKDNRMHDKLPPTITKYLLSFFETKPLCDQVLIEIETHVDKIAKKSAKKDRRLQNIFTFSH